MLKNGYLKGVLKRVLEKWVLKNGYAARVLKKGAQKGGFKLGITKGILKKGLKRSGETASGSCGRICAVYGGQCTALRCSAQRSNGPCGTVVCIGYSRGTHTTGALTGGSGWRLLCITREHTRVCTGTARVLRQKRTSRVLTAYSRVLTRYCATPPSSRHSFVCLWQSQCDTSSVHGSPGHPRVWFAWHGTVEYSKGIHTVLTGYSRSTHKGSGSDGPVCTAAWAWAHGTQCSACVRHHGVYSKVGERHRTAGTWLALLAGYSTGTPEPSTARTEAHPSTSTAAGWSQQGPQTVRVCACAAPTPVPTGTPAPTNVGDTNPPTRALTFAPTRGPNFADPTGEGDTHHTPPAPAPCSHSSPLPLKPPKCIGLKAPGPPVPVPAPVWRSDTCGWRAALQHFAPTAVLIR